MDVLIHVENGRPKIPNTDKNGTYVEDGLRPSLIGSPWEDFFTSRMGRNSLGYQNVQGIDVGWECATRGTFSTVDFSSFSLNVSLQIISSTFMKL
jgi:hypothetical protein